MLETPFSFFISKNPVEISIFGNFLAKKLIFFFQFWSIFTENPLFESGHVWKRHFDVIRWPIFMILVSMKRGDPTLYHGTNQSYFGPINFKFKWGGNHLSLGMLGKSCYKKGLVGRGLRYTYTNSVQPTTTQFRVPKWICMLDTTLNSFQQDSLTSQHTSTAERVYIYLCRKYVLSLSENVTSK